MNVRVCVPGFLLATTLWAGCSTTAIINTVPQGAKAWVRGEYRGLTPIEVKLEDGTYATATYVKLAKEGYRPTEVKLKPTWSPGFIILNVLLVLPTLGGSVYFCMLNCKTHDGEYSFPLEPASSKPPPPEPKIPLNGAAPMPPPKPPAAGTEDISRRSIPGSPWRLASR